MFKPLSLFIGLRYTGAKKHNHFVSFISLVSMIGIALGVMVLITVLSVMNGFDYQIKHRILEMVPQVTVTSWNGKVPHWQKLAADLQKKKDVVGVAPFVQGQAMITHEGVPAFGLLQGIDPSVESRVSPIAHKIIAGKLSSLQPGTFNIILGKDLAAQLGVAVGQKVTIYVPQTTMTPIGVLPRLKQFTVSGIFHVGYQFDSSYALVNYQDAATLLQLGDNVSGIQLKLNNLFLAPQVAAQLNVSLPGGLQAISWTEQNANFFSALHMEKVIMFLILLLIIAVAAFNMLSSLVMMVTDKQADIAILRTLGISTRTIMMTFVVQGAVIGIIGTVIGLIGGVILSLNVTHVINAIQKVFHVQFLSANVYYINFVPSQLRFDDVWHVCLIAIVISFLATLYPAWRAGKVKPAEALRYE